MRAALAALLLALAPAAGAAEAIATFAGGCFWCTESDFEKVPGVIGAVSGYTGGRVPNPTYEQVSAGGTGHAEAVQVRFDPTRVTYAQLLEIYWRSVDPTVKDQQFCDHGDQYRTAIFVHDAEQQRQARETYAGVAKQFGTIHTQIAEAGVFYPAEEYHQDYYVKNPRRYKFYRATCGRDARLKKLWGDAAHGK
jgi:peptide-methionine (S)-S-oxide reductase